MTDRLRQLLELDLQPFHLQVDANELQLMESSVKEHLRSDEGSRRASSSSIELAQQLITFLQLYIERTLHSRSAVGLEFANFRNSYGHAVTEQERQELVLGFALAMGASSQELAGDRRAFRRWFGYDAVSERYYRQVSVYDRRLAFALGRLGSLSAFVLRNGAEQLDQLRLWRRMELERLLRPLFTFVGNTSVRIESFRCLSNALRALPPQKRERSLSDKALKYIYRTALETTQETWLQCEALTLLESLSPQSLDRALALRIEDASSGDDLFVRRHAVRLLGKRLSSNPLLSSLLITAAMDPNPAVRQGVAEVLPLSPEKSIKKILPVLLGPDNEPAVRASAVLAIERLCRQEALFDVVAQRLQEVLQQETDRFVLRTALETVVAGYSRLRDQPELAARWLEKFLPTLSKLHTQAEHLAVRRWAAQTRERLWGRAVPEAQVLIDRVGSSLRDVPSGAARNCKNLQLGKEDHGLVGRMLALQAQQDLSLDLEQGLFRTRINRGNRFGFRFWRFLHELRHPGTDKRQAFRHTTGRLFRGNLRGASAITSELAQTRVPGEPLFIDSEEGWRPYLPLVDEMISVLDQPLSSGPLRLFTSEGVTEVWPPKSIWQRLKARLKLSLNFVHYAQLRNWQEDSAQSCEHYVAELEALGFRLSLRQHHDHPLIPTSVDPAVARFFPVGFVFPGIETMEDIRDYFFSVYENSLPELALFITLMIVFFFGRHIWSSLRIKRTRNRIPFSIGGWGTRGKSGTERLKAALFNALGHTVVSKTTGCEAMFLYGPANGSLREMFLFRPYDKATIWEQANVIDIAEKLDVDVFLWECMGLTPSYVAILQQQWMRDDIATITNTYPDHEDLQGPAGINIPQVMTNFIPKDAVLVTSEEQMLPILAEDAKRKHTPLHSVGWLEAGLITSDILSRFPYAEHPFNIALVTRLAHELGVEADFAVKEMADRVVPDLGVLRASPVAAVRGRWLEFINGMSANERFGCLGNWERMGFDQHDPYTQPDVVLSTVVNNRADRVPRSKVFASILVKDIGADMHFIIGTNLDGFINYVREAWDEHFGALSLSDDSRDRSPSQILEDAARRLRIPFREEHLRQRLWAMLNGLGVDAEQELPADLWSVSEQQEQFIRQLPNLDLETATALESHLGLLADSFRDYQRLAQQVVSASPNEQLDQLFRDQLWKWFQRKLVVIEDPHASGNQIINRIIGLSPPGLLNRVMGLQNIKGTGLDFVYRWQAWESCHRACQQLVSEDRETAEQGLQKLAGFQDYNELCEQMVRSSIKQAKQSPLAQNEWFQSALTVILSNFEQAMEQLATHLALSSGDRGAGLVTRLLAQVEAFLDAGDAVKRRKRANLIYRELAASRISHERAALELQALNKRQKGGWLQLKLEALLGRKQ